MLADFGDNGYLIIPGLLDKSRVDRLRAFLEASKLRQFSEHAEPANPKSPSEQFRERVAAYIKDAGDFESLPFQTQQYLTGHFDLETRLSDTLLEVPKSEAVRALASELLETEFPCVHMPPTARFVEPGNSLAAVPAHQDVAYNKQFSDFFVMWVPLVDITDACGGVVVHEGSHLQKEELPVERGDRLWFDPLTSSAGSKPKHCTMQAGDALLLSKWLVHESAPNHSQDTRYSIDFRFFARETGSKKHFFDLERGEVVAPTGEK